MKKIFHYKCVNASGLTDGVDARHDGDDRAVVVMVVEDVEHCCPLSSHT